MTRRRLPAPPRAPALLALLALLSGCGGLWPVNRSRFPGHA